MQWLPVTIIDKHCATTGGLTGIDIFPAVTNYITAFQIDGPTLRGVEDQARFRFAALALV